MKRSKWRDHSLPLWSGYFWQGGKEYPDLKLGYLRLTATGGHPGKDAQHAAIRRWVAPRDGTVTELSIEPGQPVTTGQVVCVIAQDGD